MISAANVFIQGGRQAISLLFLLATGRRRMAFWPDFMTVSASDVLVLIVVVLLIALMYYKDRQRGRAAVPWYQYGVSAVCIAVVAAEIGEFDWPLAVLLAWALGCTVWAFYKQRPQWSIRSILLTTVFVAIVCGVSHYVPLTAIAILVATLVGVWANAVRSQNESLPESANRGTAEEDVAVPAVTKTRAR
jgi:hypothetical protein